MHTDILIIGAGFAGTATAYHLSQNFHGTIVVIEAEPKPGLHASGLNASMVIQPSHSKSIRELCSRSRLFYQNHLDMTGFKQLGSLMLGSISSLENLQDPEMFSSYLWSAAKTQKQVPLLENHNFKSALWTPSDGIMDIQKLLYFYTQSANENGVRFCCGQRVEKIHRKKKNKFKISTTEGEITANRVVNAAGAWAGHLATVSGATSLELLVLKRHLFTLEPSLSIDPGCPAVWNLDKEFYFRPYCGSLLFCPCDKKPAHSLDSNIDPEIQEYMTKLLKKELPLLNDSKQRDRWSCFRVFTPDGLPFIGPDPSLPEFYWVAGLAGYGMSASWEIGRLAALSIIDGQFKPQFDPSRMQSN